MKKSAAIITLSFLVWQCSEPIDTYYGFEDFDLLKVGSGISDLIVSKDGNTLVASDMSNNSLIFIDIKGEMSIETSLAVGSRPKSLDLSFTGDTLFVALYGGSEIAMVDLSSRTLIGKINTEDDGPFDISFLPGNKIVASFLSSYQYDNKIKLLGIKSSESLATEETVAGLLVASNTGSEIFVCDDFYGSARIHRFSVGLESLSGQKTSSPIADDVIFQDIDYVPGYGIVLAIKGQDFEGFEVGHAYVFYEENLNLTAQLDVKSHAVAVAHSSQGTNGKSIFVAPSKADDAGMFIVEFSPETNLQINYYMTAGIIGLGTLAVDPAGEFLYAAVDDFSDNESFEPFNNNSFDIQRIEIVPEGTYPINK